MSKSRMINTKFWDDGYIVTLDPIEKLLFLYVLTNTQTNISGVYEIQMRRIAFDTGIEKDMVEKILKRFEKKDKIWYQNGWILIQNWIKNQSLNPKVKEGIKIELERAPKPLLDRLSIDYESLSYSNLNSNTNLNSNLKKQFDLFWQEYPRKVAKAKALQSWTKINPDDALVEKIIAALKKHRQTDQWKSDGGKFIPHASTWLNQKRWEDEIESAPKTKLKSYN